FPTMEALHQELQTIYRQIAGTSARFTTIPRPDTSTTTRRVEPLDPDATLRTPSKGLMADGASVTPTPSHVTPPSGALARGPRPEDRTPTAGMPGLSQPANLEAVNFRDPSQRETAARRSTAGGPEPVRKSRTGTMVAVLLLLLVAGGAAYWYLTHMQNP